MSNFECCCIIAVFVETDKKNINARIKTYSIDDIQELETKESFKNVFEQAFKDIIKEEKIKRQEQNKSFLERLFLREDK